MDVRRGLGGPHTGTFGPASSTSWRGWPDSSWNPGGRTGTVVSSRRSPGVMYRCTGWLSMRLSCSPGQRYSRPMLSLRRFICPRPVSGREGCLARA